MRILICASDARLHLKNTGFPPQLMGLLREIDRRHDVRLAGRLVLADGDFVHERYNGPAWGRTPERRREGVAVEKGTSFS